MAAAGLGLALYDVIADTDHACVAREWFSGYFSKKLCEFGRDGRAKKVAVYYDPEIDFKWGNNATAGLLPAWYLLAFMPDLAAKLFESAVESIGLTPGFGSPATQLLSRVSPRLATLLGLGGQSLAKPPLPKLPLIAATTAGLLGLARYGSKMLALKALAAVVVVGTSVGTFVNAASGAGNLAMQFGGLIVNEATELGRHDVAARMCDILESVAEPRHFGDGDFGFFYHRGEKYPRGQLSALLMTMEVNAGGDWRRFFTNKDYGQRFSAPTAVGVDFPIVGLSQAWNDPKKGTLTISTYAATPSRVGEPTSFRVVCLPRPQQIAITRDGEPYRDWELLHDGGSLELRTEVAVHTFVIHTGYTGPTGMVLSQPGAAQPDARGRL